MEEADAINSGDTIAYPVDLPIYGIGRVTEVKQDGWYAVRRFDLPGVLNESPDDLRIGSGAINLRKLLPQHESQEFRTGDYAVVASPAGPRIVTLVHNVKGDEPAVLVRDGGRFDFAAQQRVSETTAVPHEKLFRIAIYIAAK
jgi:hypothetical protein